MLTINNTSAGPAEIDIEGTIGVPEEWQFEEPAQRVATYERFRSSVEQIKALKAPEVVVNIRSTGGNVNDALLIFDALRSLGVKVTTRCYGYVASAATVIAQAASEGCREVSRNSLYLIHRSTASAEGNSEELGRQRDALIQTDRRIAEIYALRSGRSRQSLEALMNENDGNGRWLSPQEVLDNGLADRIIDAAGIAAAEGGKAGKGGKGAAASEAGKDAAAVEAGKGGKVAKDAATEGAASAAAEGAKTGRAATAAAEAEVARLGLPPIPGSRRSWTARLFDFIEALRSHVFSSPGAGGTTAGTSVTTGSTTSCTPDMTHGSTPGAASGAVAEAAAGAAAGAATGPANAASEAAAGPAGAAAGDASAAPKIASDAAPSIVSGAASALSGAAELSLKAREARRAAGPTSTLPREDPSSDERRTLSANQAAYENDLRNFRPHH